jgi:hypothetical protein
MQATPDEMAADGNPEPESGALDAFNDRLVAEGHWVLADGLAAPRGRRYPGRGHRPQRGTGAGATSCWR